MVRLVALTVVMSLGISPMTYAGEGLLESAARIVRQEVAGPLGRAATTNRTSGTGSARPATGQSAPRFAALQGQTEVLSKSGMRTRTKVMIYLAAGVGLAAAAWQIDHHVLDVTPSSLGSRRDGCKPFCGGSDSQ